mmetsp:Transcript_61712/g.109918  ORF Transcript_61712/g.109918 Transcript_61712/m.109918 type:complete len:262 (-) Transcript_61712:2045-2830(-)
MSIPLSTVMSIIGSLLCERARSARFSSVRRLKVTSRVPRTRRLPQRVCTSSICTCTLGPSNSMPNSSTRMAAVAMVVSPSQTLATSSVSSASSSSSPFSPFSGASFTGFGDVGASALDCTGMAKQRVSFHAGLFLTVVFWTSFLYSSRTWSALLRLSRSFASWTVIARTVCACCEVGSFRASISPLITVCFRASSDCSWGTIRSKRFSRAISCCMRSMHTSYSRIFWSLFLSSMRTEDGTIRCGSDMECRLKACLAWGELM